jgi:hypothetical protein
MAARIKNFMSMLCGGTTNRTNKRAVMELTAYKTTMKKII